MKLIDFLSHPALQGLEALIAIVLAMIPLAALIIRKLGNRERTPKSGDSPAWPAQGSNQYWPRQRLAEGPKGCLGLFLGTLLMIPAAASLGVTCVMFFALGTNIAPVKDALEHFKASTPNPGLAFPLVFALSVLSVFITFITCAILFRSGISRGLNFYIWTAAVLLSLYGLLWNLPSPVAITLSAASFLSACTLSGLIWLTKFAWQYG